MSKLERISMDLSHYLRHHPEKIGLELDIHGWGSVECLIEGINKIKPYQLDMETLEEVVAKNNKKRYCLSEDKTRIKAYQGHTIPGIIPELEYMKPPRYLYHGTTVDAWELIKESGAILKMDRHAVHMQSEIAAAWKSGARWHKNPVVLVIDAKAMYEAGFAIGCTGNDVWCTEKVPIEYVVDRIYSYSTKKAEKQNDKTLMGDS